MIATSRPARDPAGGDAVRNALSGLATWLVPLLLTVVVTPLVVRSLGAERFGLFALVLGAGGYALGLTPARAVVRQLAGYRANDQLGRAGELLATATLLTVALGALLGLALALGADWLAGAVLRVAPDLRESAAQALRVAALGVPLGMLAQTFGAVPQALRRIDLYGRLTTLLAVVLIGGNGLLAWFGFGVVALVGWSVATSAAGALAFLVVTRRLLPGAWPGWRLDPSLARSLLRFSAGVTAYQTFGTLLLLFERAWIQRELGSAAVAYFVVPMTIAVFLHAAVASLALAFFPLASEADARVDLPRLRAVYARASKYAAALIAWAVVTLSVTGRPLLELWLGADFAQRSATVLTLQAVAFGLVALTIVPWQVADALGRPALNASLALAWLLVGGALVVALTPRFGIAGAAAARLLSMVCLPFYLARVERLVFGALRWGHWLRTLGLLLLAAALAGALEAWALARLPISWWALAAAAGAGAALFAGCLRLSGHFDAGDVAWLRQRIAAAVPE